MPKKLLPETPVAIPPPNPRTPREETPAALPPSSPLPPPTSDYSDASRSHVCRDVENGVPLPEAFLCNGIPAKTGDEWLAAHPDFAHEVEVSRARYLRSLIQEVREALAGSGTRHDWRASFALLERADKQAATAVDSNAGRDESVSITHLSYAQLVDLQSRRRTLIN